ncbi:MAG: c-type cytochrome [Acidobacteria bacterium]|nr:c-type cytochrome [Acidobacteriota bacterium]MBW4046064.1 c-type cytochrome [Acidobacteriota bacterium]
MKEDKPQEKKTPGRLYGWLDKRTGLTGLMHASLDEPIPGGARLAYVFGSGLLFIFISQIITGLCLALYYVPSAETAHTSVAYITKQVAAGAFLRSLHYYGSSAMIIVLALHFLQTFLYGSFKGRRELLWMSGALLSLLVLAMGFTGYLLPWDQKAYFATAVGTNIVGEVPFIGEWLTKLLRGGDTLGTLTLSRFYLAHVFLIPGAIFLFIGAHIVLFRKAGPAGPINEDPVNPKLPPEGFYPRQVLMDMAFALLLMIGLGVLAYFHPVELGPVANPADTQFLPRPEWYYLPMFEWLKFWEGPKVVFAIVVVPGILALLFFLLPFLDRKLERRPWRRPIPLLGVAIVLVGAVFLGMKSHLDDAHDPTIAAQIALQDQQAKEYSKAPFQPYVESPGGSVAGLASSGPVNPLISQGKGVFEANGCSGCHGANGTGTPAAPSLVGITSKFPAAQLTALLHNPNAKMRAGNMPAVDLSASDMSALLSYLGALGTSAANVPATHKVAQLGPVPPTKESAVMGGGTSHEAEAAGGAASAEVAAGQQMFQAHACFACHGQAGAGTARVPPMRGLIAKASDQQLVALLHNPNAKMRAGGMSPLAATPQEVSSLIAYLRTLGPASAAPKQNEPATAATLEQSTTDESNATAAAAPPAAAPSSAPAAAAMQSHAAANTPASGGRAIFVANGCAACHGVNAQGTHFAPSLIGISQKFPPAQLTALLRHPTKKMRDGGMPTVAINDAQMQQLIAYLSSLGTAAPAASAQAASSSHGAPSTAAGAAPAAKAARPISAVPLSADALRGKTLFQHYSCESCHGVGGLQGTVAAPGLAGTASILPAPMLENLLRHHSKQMQKGGMPLTNLNAQDMKAIVAYIRSMPSTGAEQ